MTFDPESLHRAILNVVTNAIDACAALARRRGRSDAAERPGEPPRVEVRAEYDAAAGKLARQRPG